MIHDGVFSPLVVRVYGNARAQNVRDFAQLWLCSSRHVIYNFSEAWVNCCEIDNELESPLVVSSFFSIRKKKKTCVILRTPSLRSGHILSRSHVTVIVSSEFSVVSAEFQTQH